MALVFQSLLSPIQILVQQLQHQLAMQVQPVLAQPDHGPRQALGSQLLEQLSVLLLDSRGDGHAEHGDPSICRDWPRRH